jgi:iron complex outermembrane receptor protein
MGRKGLVASATPLLIAACVNGAGAETSAPNAPPDAAATSVGELVVTAEKHTENLQRVPLAISALNGQEIRNGGVASVGSLQAYVPGLTFSSSSGQLQLNLRGLGYEFGNEGGDPSIVTNIDGVYVASPTANSAIMQDLERVEVLRGPQGTLYGRNATGGVINLVSRTPGDVPGGEMQVTYGSYGRIQADAALEGPIAHNIFGRLYAFTDNNDGDRYNLYDGERMNRLNSYGLKGVIVSDLSDSFTLTLRGDYYHEKIGGPYQDLVAEFPAATTFGQTPTNPGGVFGGLLKLRPTITPPNNGVDVVEDLPGTYLINDTFGVGVTAQWSPTDKPWTIKSISGYRDTDQPRRIDTDGSSADILEELGSDEHERQFSQELTISGSRPNGFSWIAGGYYYHQTLDYFYLYHLDALAAAVDEAYGLPQGTIPPILNLYGHQTADSYSGFGQITVPVTSRLRLTGGVRYTYDDRSEVETITALGAASCQDLALSRSWSAVTWKANAEYLLTDANSLYVDVTRGYKSGGLNLGGCNNPFDPEYITSYSAGSKNALLNGRLTLNVDGFYYDYTNLQVTIFNATGSELQNAATARVYGAEIEGRAKLLAGLQLIGNLSVTHTEFVDFSSYSTLDPAAGDLNLAGNRLPFAQDFTASGIIAYTHALGAGSIHAQYEVYHSDGWYGDAFNSSYAYQRPYTLQNARVTYSIKNYQIGLFGENLADVKYATNFTSVGASGTETEEYGPRQRFGVFGRVTF